MHDDPDMQVYCPYCGEAIDVHVDSLGVTDDFVEDCYVCCRPIVIHVECDDAGEAYITATRES